MHCLVDMMIQKISTWWVVIIFVLVVATKHDQIRMVKAADIGVCLGLNGNDLPSATDIVDLYQRFGIRKMRLFEPNSEVLDAVRGSQIDVILGVRNEDTPNLASSPDAAAAWYLTNVEPYLKDVNFPYITVGNEIVPGEYAEYIAPAMQNLQNVLGLAFTGIKVTTVINLNVLAISYPPSSGAFSDNARAAMVDILNFLSARKNPIMINVYPYFAYASDPAQISLEYALFTATSPIVEDGAYSYFNLFDAMVDSFIAAMEKEEISNVNVVVSESGWPSAGNGDFTTPDLASIYNTNFMNHVMLNGTPRRPSSCIEAYVFAMFEENLKAVGVEQHFGLFYPNMEPVYQLFSSH